MLEKLLNKKVNAVVAVDKSLIGGVLAKAGDKVIDSSVSGQLHQLAKRL
jgi:F-type H+-transporting ATPase subunit delta